MSRRFGFAAALLFSFSALVRAQTPDTASIHGQVFDQNHGAVAGAQIKVTNSPGKTERLVESNDSGYFSLEGLSIAGTWTVTAGKPGFADASVAGLTLEGGMGANITLRLNIAGGQTHVTVTGVAGEVRTDEPQLGDYLSTTTIQETPLPNRRLTWLPMLNAANRPAINQGDVFMNENLFTSNGAGRRQAWFEVDGSTDNDSWGRQTTFANIPIDGVQEMTILENAFSAEYGGSTGSAVNIITRTGGEKLHADVLELWRPSTTTAALSGFTAANAASGNDVATDSLGQTAASVSGPLGGNESTHYFLSGEDSRENRASPVISPVAPGNFVGHYRGWLGFLRLDHRLNDRNNLFFRSDVDGFHDTNPNGIVGGNTLPTVARTFRRRTYSEEIGETFVISPTLVNNLRLQFQLASPITEFDPAVNGTQFVVPISAGGTFTTGTSQSALLMNRQYQIADTLSSVKGKQNIRYGADMIYAHTGGNSKEFGGPIYLGQFQYNTCTQSLASCESAAYLDNIANVKSYTQSYGNAAYTVNDTLWSLFVQDDYHVRSDLTINLGLRYERQTFTDSNKDFAPRVGFAYNLLGDGKTVVRGGFGIYYSQIVDNSEANYALTGVSGVFNYTATPGQVGFPAAVANAPLPAFPAGAVAPLRSIYLRPGDPTFASLGLVGYPTQLLNPYSEQWSFGLERRIKQGWILSVDYVGTHTLRINRPLDADAPAPFIRTQPGQVRTGQAANCTRPYWILWYAQHGITCNTATPTNPQPPYSVIQTDVDGGFLFYDALDVNLSHRFSHSISLLASYTWSHAIDNVDPDTTSQNPNDANFTGNIEKGNAIFDQRQRFVLSGFYTAPLKINIGGVATLASGLPYNVTTGVNNSGDTGATTDRPVINGVVIGRNTGRGTPIYDFSPFIERTFPHITLRAEAFNVLNHANFVGFSGTYGNGAAPGPGFGATLAGITNQLPARSLQFSARVFF